MSNFDKAYLGVPAIAGGIPILLKLYATISVLFVVIGFYLGTSKSVADKDLATALAALTGLVALGGFAMRQWLKYQHRSLKYHMELTENIYYRNINNNAGIFDYIIGTAEDQGSKEALLAYHFIRTAPSAPTAAELAGRVEAWLSKNFGVNVDFDIANALATLERFGLLRREEERLFVSPLDEAIAQLHRVWESFFVDEQTVECVQP
jgi:hypothetical protein